MGFLSEFENTEGSIWAIDPLKRGFIVTRNHPNVSYNKNRGKYNSYLELYNSTHSLYNNKNETLSLRLITAINDVTPERLFSKTATYEGYKTESFLHGEDNVLHIKVKNTPEWRKRITSNSNILHIEEENKEIRTHDKYVYSHMIQGDHHHPIIETDPIPFSERDIIVSVVDTGLDLTHPAYIKQQHNIQKYYLNRNNYRDIIKRVNGNKDKITIDSQILAYFALEYNDKKHHEYKLSDFHDTFSGHGTHVASSAVPPLYNTSVNPYYSRSLLAFFDIQMSLSKKLSLPGSLNWILSTSYGIGSRFLSCSWGSSETVYTAYSYELDYFIHRNYDYTAVFSVGNDGPGDGTLNSPGGTCKNCISVGASLNSYESFVEYGNKPYYMMSEYKNSSYRLVGSDIKAGVGVYNKQQLASFSSRGNPGGRIKPDLVYPGEDILALRSQGITGCNTSKTETGVCSSDGRYHTLKMGTSMSTPLLMASLTYIEPYLRHLNHIPSALRKGLLIASSGWLTGSSQQFSLDNKTNEIYIKNRNTTNIPIHEQGHGLPHPYRIVNGEFAYFPMEEIYSFSRAKTYCFSLEKEERPVSFVLSYDDPPLFGGSLTNNLNMRVTQYIVGSGINVLEVYDSNNSTYPDNMNNIEKTTIRNVKRGDHFRVSISAEGPMFSLKGKNAHQSQYYSFIWSSILSPVPCPGYDFLKWDIPKSCVLSNTTHGYYNVFTETCNNTAPIRVSCRNGKYKTMAYPLKGGNDDNCNVQFKDRTDASIIPGIQTLNNKLSIIKNDGRRLYDRKRFGGIEFYLSIIAIFLFGIVFYFKLSSVHNRSIRLFINNNT